MLREYLENKFVGENPWKQRHYRYYKKRGRMSALGGLLNRKKGSQAFQELRYFFQIQEKWPQYVGPRWGRHGLPIAIQHGRLVIATRNSAVGQTLSFSGQSLVKKINQDFPTLKINGLRFIVNPKALERENFLPPKEDKFTHKYSPHFQKTQETTNHICEGIEDTELRDLMEKIYIQGQVHD